jgi:tetratricopeptide (TPR) repeat protein
VSERVRAAALVAALIACGPGAAAADDPPVDPAADAEAQRRFTVGREHLERGEFEAAAREFEIAYDLSGRPELLFNIALAYRDAGKLREAINALERYLASGAAEADRPRLEQRLRSMRADLAAREAATGADVEAETSPLVLSGIVVAGTGAAAMLASIATGLLALDAQATLDADYCDAGALCDPGFEPTLDTARTFATATDVLLLAGGAALVIGAALVTTGLLLGDGEAPAAALACDGTTCVASLGGALW